MSILNIIPQNLKRELLDRMAHGIGEWADEHGHESIAKSAKHLASDHAFLEALDRAWKSGVERFNAEYDDQGMVTAIGNDTNFWKSPSVKGALLKLASRPGAWLEAEQATVNQHFDDVLPGYPREQVSRAVNSLLRYIVEALWQLPGAAQVRELYAFQFQKLTAEAVMQQVQLGQAQLASAQQLGSDLRDMVAQLNQLVAQTLPGAATPALSSGVIAALIAPAADSDVTGLYEQMNAHLSDDDLRLLCVRLAEADSRLRDLDRQNLPTGKSAAVLNLLDILRKRGALQQLRSVLEQHHPYALDAGGSRVPATTSQLPYSNLPAFDISNFVGRQKEQEWLRTRLAASHPARQLVVLGIGGAGKSSLAVAVAEDYLRRYHELPEDERFAACVWVSAKEKVLTVEGQEQADFPEAIFHTLGDIYTAIAQTLEREDITRAATPEEQQRLVQKALKNYRTLLIVDNLESIRSEPVREQVKTFLRRLPAPSKAIITTREWTGGDNVLKVGGLSDEDASAMIANEAEAQGVNITPAQRQQLLELTAGLPLPIKLAIARLASDESFAQVVRWLSSASGDLPEYCVRGQADLVEQRSVGAWKLLLAASLFDREAGASREALGQIAELSEEERDEGLTLLQRLSLLSRSETDRFSMLPIVQRYVGARLAEVAFNYEMLKHWVKWAKKVVEECHVNMEFHLEKQMLILEYKNLWSAMRWCEDNELWPDYLRLAESLWLYPYMSGSLTEALEILEASVRASKLLDDTLSLTTFTRRLGSTIRAQGSHEKALLCFNEAEAFAMQYGYEIELGWVLSLRADILFRYNIDKSKAIELAEQVFQIGERHNNIELKLRAAYRKAEFATEWKQFDEAIKWLNFAEGLARGDDYIREYAWIAHRMGDTLLRKGDLANAEERLMLSLTMSSTWNERRLIGQAKQDLATLYHETGMIDLARQFSVEALDLFERSGMSEDKRKAEEFLHHLQPTEHSQQSLSK